MAEPAAPADVERVRASFARQRAMATLGIALEEVRRGVVVLSAAHRPELTQQHGYLHAGIVATALDSACGYAAFSLMPPEAAVLTVEYKVNLLAPAKGPRFRFEARVVKPGRTLSVVEGRAVQVDAAGAEKLIATMSATLMTVIGRDIQH